MAIAIFDIPIPVVVDENGTFKDGYAMYVESGGPFSNDLWCVSLCDGGVVRHYRSDQIRVHHNGTLGINKDKNDKIL